MLKMRSLILSMLCLLAAFALKGQVNLDDGLQAHYPFTGNADDVSGNNYHGVNIQATLTTDRLGNTNSAYDFSGGDKYIDFGNVFNETIAGVGNSFSFSFWIKPASDDMSNNFIIGKNADFGCEENERQFYIRFFENQNLNVTYQSSLVTGNSRRVITTNSLTDTSMWYHIAVMYNGSLNSNNGIDRVSIYVNCQTQETYLDDPPLGVLGNIQEGNAHFGIGNNLDSSGEPCQSSLGFEGAIDDIRFYNRLLNEEEITRLCLLGTTSNEIISDNPPEIKIYPNPTSGQIYLENLDIGNNRFIIRSLAGRILLKGNIGDSVIDLSKVASGVYHFELINADNEAILRRKIIKL